MADADHCLAALNNSPAGHFLADVERAFPSLLQVFQWLIMEICGIPSWLRMCVLRGFFRINHLLEFAGVRINVCLMTIGIT